MPLLLATGSVDNFKAFRLNLKMPSSANDYSSNSPESEPTQSTASDESDSSSSYDSEYDYDPLAGKRHKALDLPWGYS